MRYWVTRILCLLFGWRLSMAYPLDDSWQQLVLSVVVGTLGVLLVAMVAYGIGFDRGQTSAAGPAEQQDAGAVGRE